MYKRLQRKTSSLLLIFILKLTVSLVIEEYSPIAISRQENQKQLWSSVLRQIDMEAYFDYALIVGEIQQEFLLDLLEVELKKCVLLNGNFTVNYDLDIFVNNFISIVFIPKNLLKEKENIEPFIRDLGDKLDLKRFTRLIFVEQQVTVKESENATKILLQMCKLYKFLNVIVVFKDFPNSQMYYSYNAFPYFEVVKNNYNNQSFSGELYPSKMNNVYGEIVRTIPDQIMPRSVVYTDAKGQLRVTGYIAQFIRMYGKYINCTIKYPDNLVAGEVLFYRDFFNWTKMDLLDIPCSITPMAGDNTSKLMSYMYEVLNWCLMMPVEQPLTYQDFLKDNINIYTIVGILIMNTIFTSLLMTSKRLLCLSRKQKFSWNLADILANPQVILGHLGSSFSLHPHPILSLRIIYVSLFLSGLLYTTTFSVQLNAFLTHPSVQQINSLDDMLKYKRKILAAQNEYKTLLKLSGSTFLPYLSLFHIIDSYKEFSEIRGSFNTAYSYPVTSSVWHVYQTQQQLFSKPLFRRTDLCFVNLDIMGFILPPNSLHKLKLDTLITRVRDMGFVHHWLQNNFYDLVKIGKMSLSDISVNAEHISYIQAKDFYYVLFTMLKAFGVSLAIFLIEIFWFYRYSILRLLYLKPIII
ncbi:uncharacterized protein LOC119616369 [Lucilia sericata]|uniref:uncharacterized protein LOC119616369 n=1 Tax=Lucilia sericata TaxID=13632 RepID=UPI0018A80A60|nr:uncharacterized protein LOC119616369 [Lucilia sericata]